MEGTEVKLYELTVRYTLTETQMEKLRAHAVRDGSSPEDYFQFLMTIGQVFEIEKRLELLKEKRV